MRTTKQDNAIAHITEQMMADAKDGKPGPESQAIEEMLTGLCTTDAVAEKLLAEGKSPQGAYDALFKEAKDNRNGKNVVCISPQKAQQIIEKYYGITDNDKADQRSLRRSRSARVDVLSQI